MRKATTNKRVLLLLLAISLTFALLLGQLTGVTAVDYDTAKVASADVIQVDSVSVASADGIETLTDTNGKVYYFVRTAPQFKALLGTNYVADGNVVVLAADFNISWSDWYSRTKRTFSATLDGTEKTYVVENNYIQLDANGEPRYTNSTMHTITLSHGGTPAGSNTGLFDSISGTIQNLAFVAGEMYVNHNSAASIGALCGTLDSTGRIINCSLTNEATMSINGSGVKVMGGMIGVNNGGLVKDCTFNMNGEMAAESDVASLDKTVGGLVGRSNGGVYTNNTFTINGSFNINSLNTALGTTHIGGLIGDTTGTVTFDAEDGAKSTFSYYSGMNVLAKPTDGGEIVNITSGTVALGSFIGQVTGNVNVNKTHLYLSGSIYADTQIASADNIAVSGFVGEAGAGGNSGVITISNSIFYNGFTNTTCFRENKDDGIVNLADEYTNTYDPTYKLLAKVTVDNGNCMNYSNNCLFIMNEWNVSVMADTGASPSFLLVATHSGASTPNAGFASANSVSVVGSGEYLARFEEGTNNITVVPRIYSHTGGDVSPFYGWYNEGVLNSSRDNVNEPARYTTNITTYTRAGNYYGMQALTIFPANLGLRLQMLFLTTTVSQAYELTQVANNVNNGMNYAWADITLTADITFTKGLPPIGNNSYPFQADFEGGGYTITLEGVWMDNNGSQYAGIFGYNIGTISNVNVDFQGTIDVSRIGDNVQYYAGVLCGRNSGHISNVDVRLSSSNTKIVNTNVGASGGSDALYFGGAVGIMKPRDGANSQVVSMTDVNVINYGEMRTYYPSVQEGTVSYLGGVVGGIEVSSGNAVSFTSISCELQGQMKVDNAASYMGGMVGSVIVSSGGKLAVSSLGVSVGRYAISDPSKYIFQYRANTITDGVLTVVDTAQSTFSNRVGNLFGTFTYDNASDIGGKLINLTTLTFSTSNPREIWLSTDTEAITKAKFEDEPANVGLVYTPVNTVFNYVGTETAAGAITTTGRMGQGTVSAHNKILIEGAVLSVTCNDNGHLLFSKPAITGFQFAGWYNSAFTTTAYPPNNNDFDMPDGNLLTRSDKTNLIIYSYIIDQRIKTVSQLNDLSMIVANGNTFEGITFTLAEDLVLDSTIATCMSIGTYTTPFSGRFNGNGKSITLTGGLESLRGHDDMNDYKYIALFSAISDSASVYNLTMNVENYNVSVASGTSIPYYFAGIVGINNGAVGSSDYLRATTVNITNSTIELNGFGGICYTNGSNQSSNATITNVFVNIVNSNIRSIRYGQSTDSVYTGGLIAVNNCALTGAIVTIDSLSSLTATAATTAAVGGAVANNYGRIDGVCVDISTGNLRAIRAITTASVNFKVGALVGITIAEMTRSYMLVDEGLYNNLFYTNYAGTSTQLRPVGADSTDSGNVISVMSGYDNASYCGDISVRIIQGIELQFIAAYRDGFDDSNARPFSQWNVEGNDVEDPSAVEQIEIGTAHKVFTPTIQYNDYKGCTVLALFVNKEINDIDDLIALSNDINSGFAPSVDYVLTSTINVSGLNFNPIGLDASHPFIGSFYGSGDATIIVRTASAGGSGYTSFLSLFGVIADNASVQNLTITVESPIVIDGGSIMNYAGTPAILAQTNNGRISNVTINVNSDIKGTSAVSAGVNVNNGVMTQMKLNVNAANIYTTNANSVAGGLIAVNNGFLGTSRANYYSNKLTLSSGGSIYSEATGATVGGLVGINNGTIYSAESEITGTILATGDDSTVGGVVGLANSGSYMEHVGAEIITESAILAGNLYAKLYVGGIVGELNGELVDSEAKIKSSIGSLLGQTAYAKYIGAVAAVIGVDAVVTNSTVSVQKPIYGNDFAGGFAATASGEISGVTVDMLSSISGANTVGGVIGSNNARISNSTANIGDANSVNTAFLSASAYVGGFAGRNSAEMTNVLVLLYAELAVTSEGGYAGSVDGFSNPGAIGTNVWTVFHNDIAEDTSGNGAITYYNQMSIVGEQNLIVNMNNTSGQITFTVREYDRQDFYNWYDISTGSVLLGGMSLTLTNSSNGKAYFASFFDLDIDEDTNANRVAHFNELATAALYSDIFRGVTISLKEDILVENAQLIPLGTKASPFNGTFLGNGHSITFGTMSSISGLDYSGIFGVVGSRGSVSNLRIDVGEGVSLGGTLSERAGILAGVGNGTFTNIVINTLSSPVGDMAGLFAGQMGITATATNVWVVAYNNDLHAVGDGDEVTDITTNHLVTTNARGVNKLAVVGTATVEATLNNGSITFGVPSVSNNDKFGGWYINSTITASGDYVMLESGIFGDVQSNPDQPLYYRPSATETSLINKVFTLSFIELRITDFASFRNFANNVNTYSGLGSLTFSFEPEGDSKELVIDGQQLVPIGQDYYNSFSSIFEGNGNKLVIRNCTFNGSFAAIFGYVSSSAVIRNLIVELDNNSYGGNAQYINYAAGLAAYLDGTVDNVAVKVGSGNDFSRGTGKAVFVGTLNTNAVVSNSWAVVSEFLSVSLYVSDYTNGANTLNKLTVAGEGTLSITMTSSGNLNFSAASADDEFDVYLNTSGTLFVESASGGFEVPNAGLSNVSYVILFAKCLIETEEELRELAAIINRGTDYPGVEYKLGADIVIDDDATFAAIGGQYNTRVDGKLSVFSGIFDGAGYTVTISNNVTVTGAYAGLFGRITDTALIKNVILKVDGTIGDSTTGYAAGIVASADEITKTTASILNCVVRMGKSATFVASYGAAYVTNSAVFNGLAKDCWAAVYNSAFNDEVLTNTADDADVNIITIIGAGVLDIEYSYVQNVASGLDLLTTLNFISDIQPEEWDGAFEYVNGAIKTFNVAVGDNLTADLYTYSVQVGSSGMSLAVSYLKTVIENTEDLVRLSHDVRDYVDFYGVTFSQTANITVGADDDMVSIGNGQYPFTAKYDGNNFSITLDGGITFSGMYAGLFGSVASSSIISNLKIVVNDAVIDTALGGYGGIIAYNEGAIDSVVIETYGLQLLGFDSVSQEAVDAYIDTSTYVGGGIGYSPSLYISNSWVVVATANLLPATGYLDLDDQPENGINLLRVIGLGRISTSLSTDLDGVTTVTFTEILLERDSRYKQSGWYLDYTESFYINNNSGMGTITDLANGTTSFVPVTTAINQKYEVALIYTDVSSIEDLNAIAYDVNAGYQLYNLDFILSADIYIKEVDGAFNNVTIGSGAAFWGSLTGNNRTIYIEASVETESAYFSSLFGVINGSVSDINVIIRRDPTADQALTATLRFDEGAHGIFAQENYGTITNVNVTLEEGVIASATTNGSLSLLVGTNQRTGTISDATVVSMGDIEAGLGTVTNGTSNVGLISIYNNGTINDVTVDIYGNVNSDGNIGGISATNTNIINEAVVRNLHLEPVRDAETGTILISILNTGNSRKTIRGKGYVGLIAGQNTSIINSVAVYGDSNAVRNLSSSNVGLLVGANEATIQNTWLILLSDDEAGKTYAVGTGKANNNTLVVNGSGIIEIAVADEQISFENVQYYTFEGDSTATPLGKGIYGWFDVEGNSIQSNDTYGSASESMYIASSILASQTVYVEFTNEKITTASELFSVAKFVNNGRISLNVTYQLENNIVINAEDIVDFDSIGISSNNFTGTFDGNDKTIRINGVLDGDITLGQFTNLALFGYVGATAVIKDLTVIYSVDFGDETADIVGGLVAVNNGFITNCHVVIGNSAASATSLHGKVVGGLVGQNKTNGIIYNCSVSILKGASINATSSAGGFATENQGVIYDSFVYNEGTIEAKAESLNTIMAAGIVTVNNGTMNNVNTYYTNTVDSLAYSITRTVNNTASGAVRALNVASNNAIGSGEAHAALYAVKNTGTISNVIIRVPRADTFIRNRTAEYKVDENVEYLVFARGINPKAAGLVITNMDAVQNVVLELPYSLIHVETTTGGNSYKEPAIYSTNRGNEEVRNVWILLANDQSGAITSGTADVNIIYINENAYVFEAVYNADTTLIDIPDVFDIEAFQNAYDAKNHTMTICARFEKTAIGLTGDLPLFRIIDDETGEYGDSLSVADGLVTSTAGDNYAYISFVSSATTYGFRVLPRLADTIYSENDWYTLAGYFNSHGTNTTIFDANHPLAITLGSDIELNGAITPINLTSDAQINLLGSTSGTISKKIIIGETATFTNDDDKALFIDLYGSVVGLVVEIKTNITAPRAAAIAINNKATSTRNISVKMLGYNIVPTVATSDVNNSPLFYNVTIHTLTVMNGYSVVTDYDNAWVNADGYSVKGITGTTELNARGNSFLLIRGDGNVNIEATSGSISYRHDTDYLNSVGGYFVGTNYVDSNGGAVYDSKAGVTWSGGNNDFITANRIVDFVNLIVTIRSGDSASDVVEDHNNRLLFLSHYSTLPTFYIVASYGAAQDHNPSANIPIEVRIDEDNNEIPEASKRTIYGIRMVFDNDLFDVSLGNELSITDVEFSQERLSATITFISDKHLVFRQIDTRAATVFEASGTTEDGRTIYEEPFSIVSGDVGDYYANKRRYTALITHIETAEQFYNYIGGKLVNGNTLNGITFKIDNNIVITDEYAPIGSTGVTFEGTIDGAIEGTDRSYSITINNGNALFDSFNGKLSNLIIGTDLDELQLIERAGIRTNLDNVYIKVSSAKVGSFIIVEDSTNVNSDGAVVPYTIAPTTNAFSVKYNSAFSVYEYSFVVNEIYTVAEYNLLANAIYNYNTTYSGITITLMNDLNGVSNGATTLSELAYSSSAVNRSFNGTFNGNNKTIYTTAYDSTGAVVYLFGSIGGIIRDLNVQYDTTYIPFLRQRTAGADSTVSLSYVPNNVTIGTNNFVLWYNSTGDVVTEYNDGSNMTDTTVIRPFSLPLTIRNYAFSLKFNEIGNYTELVALTATNYATGKSFLGKEINVVGDIEVESLSQFAADVNAHNSNVTAASVTSFLKDFNGNLLGNFHVITVNNFDVDTFSVFDSIVNNDNSLVSDLAFVFKFVDAGKTATTVVDNAGDTVTAIYQNVWLIKYDDAIASGNSAVKCINIDDASNGEVPLVIGRVDDNFTIYTTPVTLETDKGFFYDEDVPALALSVRNERYSTLTGVDIFNRTYTLNNEFTVTIEKFYMLQAMIGMTTLQVGLGYYSENEVATFDFNSISELSGYIIDDAEVVVSGTELSYAFSTADKKVNIKSLRSLITARKKTYDYQTNYGYDIDAVMSSVVAKAAGTDYEVSVTYTNTDRMYPTDIVRVNYALNGGIWTPGVADNDTAPRDAGIYVVTFVATMDDVVIGSVDNITYEIEKASLFTSLSVSPKQYDGTTYLQYTNPPLNLQNPSSEKDLDPMVMQRFVIEYDSSVVGSHYVVVVRNLVETVTDPNYTAYARNYQLVTDEDGYLLIGGQRVSGSITERKLTVGIVDNSLTITYGSSLGDIDEQLASLSFIGASKSTETDSVVVYRRSELSGNPTALTSISLDTGLSSSPIAEFLVALILEDTLGRFEGKNVGLYSPTADIKYVSLYTTGNANFSLESDVEDTVVTIVPKSVSVKITSASYSYTAGRPNINGNYASDYRNRNVTVVGAIAKDSLSYTILETEVPLTQSDIGEGIVQKTLLNIDAEEFNKSNPNYVLETAEGRYTDDISSPDYVNESDRLFVYDIVNGEFTDSYLYVVKSTIEIREGFNNTSREYGLAAAKALALMRSVSTLAKGDRIALFISADEDENGVIDITKASIAATDISLAVGNYDIIVKVLHDDKTAGTVTDVTANYDLMFRDSNLVLTQYNPSEHNYTVQVSKVAVDTNSIKVERLKNGNVETDQVNITYKVYVFSASTFNRNYVMTAKYIAKDSSGNDVEFIQRLTIPVGSAFESSDVMYELKNTLDGASNPNYVLSKIGEDNKTIVIDEQPLIKKTDVYQYVQVKLGEKQNLADNSYTAQFNYGENEDSTLYTQWTKYFSGMDFIDRNTTNSLGETKFEVNMVLVRTSGTSSFFYCYVGEQLYEYKNEADLYATENIESKRTPISSLPAGDYSIRLYYEVVDGNMVIESAYAADGAAMDFVVPSGRITFNTSNNAPASTAEGGTVASIISVTIGGAIHVAPKKIVVRLNQNNGIIRELTVGDDFTIGSLTGDIIDGDEYIANNESSLVMSGIALTEVLSFADDFKTPKNITSISNTDILFTKITNSDQYRSRSSNYEIVDIMGLDDGETVELGSLKYLKRVMQFELDFEYDEYDAQLVVDTSLSDEDRMYAFAMTYDDLEKFNTDKSYKEDRYAAINEFVDISSGSSYANSNDNVEFSWTLAPTDVANKYSLEYTYTVKRISGDTTTNVTSCYTIVLNTNDAFIMIVEEEETNSLLMYFLVILIAIMLLMLFMLIFFRVAINKKNRELLMLKESEDDEDYEYIDDTEEGIMADSTEDDGSGAADDYADEAATEEAMTSGGAGFGSMSDLGSYDANALENDSLSADDDAAITEDVVEEAKPKKKGGKKKASAITVEYDDSEDDFITQPKKPVDETNFEISGADRENNMSVNTDSLVSFGDDTEE